MKKRNALQSFMSGLFYLTFAIGLTALSFHFLQQAAHSYDSGLEMTMYVSLALSIGYAIYVFILYRRLRSVLNGLSLSNVGLNLTLRGLMKEDKKIQKRLLTDFADEISSKPDLQWEVLSKIESTEVIELIQKLCDDEVKIGSKNLSSLNSFSVEDDYPQGFPTEQARSYLDRISQFQKLHSNCDLSLLHTNR